jgi:VWFA-related protein
LLTVIVATGLLAGNLVFTQALAQNQKPDQEQIVKLKSELISVRAVVTDKSGKVIDGLKKEDFELLESNRPQEISFFSLEKLNANAREPGGVIPHDNEKVNKTLSPSSPSSKAIARTIVLFVDTFHMAQEGMVKLKETLRRFIDDKLSDQDTVALITTNRQLGVLEQFTHDRQLLRKAVDKLSVAFPEVSTSMFTPYLAAQVLKKDPDAVLVGRIIIDSQNGGNRGSISGRSGIGNRQMQDAEVVNEARNVLLREGSLRQASLATLKAITERLTEMPGQRLLTIFSDGFTLLSDSAQRDLVDVKGVTSRAVRAGVMIYSFDTKGLVASELIDASRAIFVSPLANSRGPDITAYWSSLRASTAIELEEGVSTLAADTGGKAIFNTNDLLPNLQKAVDENRLYYGLDYYSSNDVRDNKFRPITVRVKNHPEYEVRAQKGYLPAVAKKEEEKDATPFRQLARAMLSPLPVTTIGVAASPASFEIDGDEAQVSLFVFVDASTLTYAEKEKRHLFDVDLAIALHDQSGKVIKTFSEKLQGGLTDEQLAAAKRNGYRYTRRLALEPGLFNIRVGLFDNNSGKIGTAIAWTEVPNLSKGRLTLSNLILSTAGDSESETKAAEAAKPAWRDGLRFYKNGETLSYLAKVYNFSTDANLTTQTQIVQGETVVYRSDWQSISARMTGKDKKGIELAQELQLGKAGPGMYELKILVKDARSNQLAESNVWFAVER